MNGRAWLAGIVGGVVFYIWLSIVHVATPLGMVGFSNLSNDEAMMAALKANVPHDGLYFIPGMNMSAPDRKAEMARAMELMRKGPTGIMVVHVNGAEPMTARQLITEFLSNIVQALLLVWLIVHSRLTSFSSRVQFAAVVGLLASMATNVSYWNWYGFPGNYTAVYMLTAIIGYVLIGCVAAWMKVGQTT